MANPLATLGQFRIGTTEYSAGRARTDGSWHLVRKQYGNDSSTFNYARFSARADYLAALANPDGAPWVDEPYSAVDYTLLLLGLTTPLPASTVSTGTSSSDAATQANQATLNDLVRVLTQTLPVRNADGSMAVRTPDTGEPLYVRVARSDTPPSLPANAATQSTLEAVRALLAGTLAVSVGNFPAVQHVVVDNPAAAQSTVAVSNFPAIQNVSGPLTDGQLRASPVAVTLAFPASQPVTGAFFQATQPVSGTFWQATQPISAAALPLPAGAAQDGTDIASPVAMPAGGAGIRGWLSAIWTKLNGSLAVTGAFYPATQPVSLATNAPDVTDRAGRQLGIVTVANPVTTVTVANPAAATDVSGLAKDATLAATNASLGADGTNPPAVAGTGVRGWLRAIYEKVAGTLAVSGTFWQATQPVSALSLPLPLGASTAANQAAMLTALGPLATAALQTTGNGYLQTLAQASSAVALTRYSLVSAAGQNLTLIKTGAVNLYALHLSNNSGATRIVAFYNKATAPAAGDVPALSIALPAGGSFRYALDGKPDAYALGLGFSVGASAGTLTTLTGVLLTALAAGDVSVTAHYA